MIAVLLVISLSSRAQAEPRAWLGVAIGDAHVPLLSSEIYMAHSPPSAARTSSPAAAAKTMTLPVLFSPLQRTVKPATAIGRLTLPADSLTQTNNVWGVALNLDHTPGAAGQSLTVLAGAVPPSGGAQAVSDGYTTGLAWARNNSNGDRLDMRVLFSQPSAPGSHGQWLASMGSHVASLPFLSGIRLEAEMAVACDDSSQTQDTGNIGSLVKLTGSMDKLLNYQVTLSRFGADFHPQGFVLQSGRQAVTANVHYRLSPYVHLYGATEFAEENFESNDPYRYKRTALTLSGPIFHAFIPDLSAVLKTSSETYADDMGNMNVATRQLAIAMAQPLLGGWRYRLGVAMNQTVDSINMQGFDSSDFHVAGNHRLYLGRFSGSIGPGLAWRTRNGFEAHQDFEAGVALKLHSRDQIVALNLGYLTQSGLPGLYSSDSIKFGLSYSLYFNNPIAADSGNAWYLSDADGL